MIQKIRMQKTTVVFLLLLCFGACAQTSNSGIDAKEVARIESTLASDSMQGRRAGTAGNDKAAQFIAAEFKKAGLQPLNGNSYLQSFQMVQPQLQSVQGTVNGNAVSAENIQVLSLQPQLHVTDASGYTVAHIKAGEAFRNRVRTILRARQNQVVFVDTSFATPFADLAHIQRPHFAEELKSDTTTIIFVLGDYNEPTFTFDIRQQLQQKTFNNVVGVIPGTSKKDEQVVFSAHYDHLGIGELQAGDSIYNGANDDASGTTAVISLARHFKQLHNNAGTLVFVAFTAEEIGGFGSQYFSRQLNPEKVVAMFNIEMIGTESKWGRNSAYITGYDKSDMGAILQRNLAGSQFTFHPDPYTEQQLFYRSDNATLARLGVPAHTISTSKMDNEPNYHQASDEVKTLDLQNMTEIIKAIAKSSGTIVSGKDTPTRVEVASLRQ